MRTLVLGDLHLDPVLQERVRAALSPAAAAPLTAAVTRRSLAPGLSCRGASGNQGDRVEFADVWRRAVYVSQMELVCFHMEATLFLCRVLLICP